MPIARAQSRRGGQSGRDPLAQDQHAKRQGGKPVLFPREIEETSVVTNSASAVTARSVLLSGDAFGDQQPAAQI